MQINPIHFYWIYILSVPFGFLFTSHFLRLKKKYFWHEYVLLFVLPGLASAFLYVIDGVRVLIVFFTWFALGPFLEAMIGYTYLGVTKKHLWIYERFSMLNRTTSILSAPFWAFAGLGVWAFNELIRIYVK